MKRYIVMLILVLITTSLFGQNAKVVPLSEKDAIRAASLYKTMKDAEKAWEDFQTEVRENYLVVKPNKTCSWEHTCTDCISVCNRYKDGFNFGGFSFSEDFKFIVPKENSISYTWAIPCYPNNLIGTGGTTTYTAPYVPWKLR